MFDVDFGSRSGLLIAMAAVLAIGLVPFLAVLIVAVRSFARELLDLHEAGSGPGGVWDVYDGDPGWRVRRRWRRVGMATAAAAVVLAVMVWADWPGWRW